MEKLRLIGFGTFSKWCKKYVFYDGPLCELRGSREVLSEVMCCEENCEPWKSLEKSPDFYDADELCLRCAHEFDCVTCNQIKLGQIEAESFCDDWCDEWEEKEKL